ncbi:MAG: hydratase [Betaproteobacteria bacterium]|jgi:2-keto-4-pentenoate hydratase|nr:MAG: hydratase [Betaproteobacteria bacterium]
MNQEQISESAAILWKTWMQSGQIDALPKHCRPTNREEAYAVQAELARLSEQQTFGWKIAATSTDGQKHIGVDGPIAGRLLSGRVVQSGGKLVLGENLMKVAEAEFAFRIGKSLPPRSTGYSTQEVLAAVDTLHPAIEIPDSRYTDFARVGAPQLIADNACACWFILGPETDADWRSYDLSAHEVTAWRNDGLAARGTGANVLGDPRVALTWIANELRSLGIGLAPGEVVTTGTCVLPQPIVPGDKIRADFGNLGSAVIEIG